MQIDSALRREQWILSGCPHTDTPTAEAKKHKERGVTERGGHHQDGGKGGDTSAARKGNRRIGEAERLTGILLLWGQ